MCGDRVNTAVLGVERAPMPSRVSRVRNMETSSWSGALMRVGKPIVRGAELLGGTGCPRSKCRWPKGPRRHRAEDSDRPEPAGHRAAVGRGGRAVEGSRDGPEGAQVVP